MIKVFLNWVTLILIVASEVSAMQTSVIEKASIDKTHGLIPRHILFGNPEKTSPSVSPDGTKLAYLAPDEHDILNVWIRDLVKETPDVLITADQKRGIRSFIWQYDNQHILYFQDDDGDENWHLYQTNIQTKDTHNLTPFQNVRSEIISYQRYYPNELLIGLNLKNKALFDVYRLNLLKRTVELDTANPGDVIDWTADHNLIIRSAMKYTSDGGGMIQVRNDAQSPWRDFLQWGPEDALAEVVGFTGDNQWIYVITSLKADTERLLKINLSDGRQEVIFSDPNYDISDIISNPITHEIEAVGIDRDKYAYVPLDERLKSDFQSFSRIDKAPFKVVSRDLSENQWIIASLSDVRPTRFYLYDRSTKKAAFLFSTQPKLENYTLASMQPVTFKARDGMMINGYLTLPPSKDPHQLPLVILVHGGPWTRDSWGLRAAVQWLANRGYAVFQINYRGSSGFGKKYLEAGNREWAGKMQTDLIDGKNWLIEKGIADSQKVAIYGGSYGGYAALVGLSFTPDEFCCGVDVVGPSNLVTLLQTIPPYWAPMKVQFDQRVGKLETEKEFLEARSPLFKASSIKKPLLIAQGANDPRVKKSESDQIVEAMRKNGQQVQYLLFTDEGHGFVRPENQKKFIAATEHFLAEYLGGKEEPPSAEEDWEALKK